MSEDEAREWLRATFGPAALLRMERFVSLLLAASVTQNLIAPSTVETVWNRHIADSAQLIRFGPAEGLWIDIGSGAGLPGLIVAILRDGAVLLVEPRAKRATFLKESLALLRLKNATVSVEKAQVTGGIASVISARAVAPISEILGWTASNVSRETRYVLPRGRSAASELAITKQNWQGVFHVEQSLTDPDAGIVVARKVARR